MILLFYAPPPSFKFIVGLFSEIGFFVNLPPRVWTWEISKFVILIRTLVNSRKAKP
jgi:hypothetical protein